jgi:hypothetical protein
VVRHKEADPFFVLGIKMHPTLKALASVVVLAGATAAHAVPIAGQGTWESTLQARDIDGDGAIDAYYDTSLNITWLANANANGADQLMGWAQANSWAANLTIGAIDDWRLPSITDVGNDGCSYVKGGGGLDCGFKPDPTSSELAYMYYITLGNLGASIPDGLPGDGVWGVENTGNFVDVRHNVYWSSTNYAQEAGQAWGFSNYYGYQGPYADNYGARAWAVRDGDVLAVAAPVPEPETYALMFAGMLLIGAMHRKRSN